MATIDKLQKLISTKSAIKDAINQKGGSVTDQDKFSNYPNFILALNVSSSSGSGDNSDGNPQNFSDIGYNFFPIHIQDYIEYSKEYQNEYNERNDNVLKKDENLIYFPMIEINEDIDTIQLSDDTSTSNTYHFVKWFPNLKVFPEIDFKGKSLTLKNTADNVQIFRDHTAITQVFFKNISLPNGCECMFYNCPTLEYVSFNNVGLGSDSLQCFCQNCTGLKKVIFTNMDLSNITSLYRMFYSCKSIESFEGFTSLNIPNVTDIREMFYDNGIIKELDFSNWNPESVTKMNRFIYDGNFYGRNNPYELVNLSGWNLNSYVGTTTTSSTEEMILGHFKLLDLSDWSLPKAVGLPLIYNWELEGIIKCTNWNLPKLKSLTIFLGYNSTTGTYSGCKKVNLSGWNIPTITSIGNVTRCTKIEELDLSNWNFGEDRPGTISMSSLINSASVNMKRLILTNWDFSNFKSISFGSHTNNKNDFQIIGPISGINVSSLTLSSLPPNTTVDSLMVMINGLNNIEDGTTHKLLLGTTFKSKLTQDQIAVATSKGWTVT